MILDPRAPQPLALTQFVDQLAITAEVKANHQAHFFIEGKRSTQGFHGKISQSPLQKLDQLLLLVQAFRILAAEVLGQQSSFNRDLELMQHQLMAELKAANPSA